MSERDPIDILEGIADAAEDPDPAFSERLLDEMLLSLASDSRALTPAPIFALPDEESLPVLDLLSHANEGSAHMSQTRIFAGVLAAAAAIALIVGVLISIDGDDTVRTVPAATTEATAPTTAALVTTTAPAFGAEEGLAVVDAYFAATRAGDFAAIRELFAADATFASNGPIADAEKVFAWDVGQGTTITEPDCTVFDGDAAESAIVSCNYFNRDALVQAVDGPQVPITATLTVTPDGISRERVVFGQPDFDAVHVPFSEWMWANHPEDVDKVGFISWDSIEQAEAYGMLRVRYAAEWAAHLEASDCTYLDGACSQ